MAPSLFRQDVPGPDEDAPAADSKKDSDVEPQRHDRSRGRRDRDSSTVSVLGPGLTVEGEIKSNGDVRIEGKLDGNLSCEGQVNVTSTGVIEGDLTADRLVVAGKVKGSLTAGDSARLVSGCRVEADVRSPRLELEDGAMLNGRVDMGGSAGASKAPREADRGPRDADKPRDADTEPERAQGAA